MKVFYHHIYELKKGLRDLILHTTTKENQQLVERRLKSENIDYLIYELNNDKINIFFGNNYCVNVIRKIDKKSLLSYSVEEDFILGSLLGYNKIQQCERYLELKEKSADIIMIKRAI